MSAIAEKIRKIIAKADGTTHEAEAAAFMEKAQAMMIENGISMMDLGTINEEDPVGEDVGATINVVHDRWRLDLGCALARYFGCKPLYTSRKENRTFLITGRESARVTFAMMYPYADRQVMALALAAKKAGLYPTVSKARNAIGNALTWRVHAMRRESIQKHEGSGTNALVPVDVIAQFIEEKYGAIKKARPAKLATDTFAVQQAATINLNLQATGRATPRLS